MFLYLPFMFNCHFLDHVTFVIKNRAQYEQKTMTEKVVLYTGQLGSPLTPARVSSGKVKKSKRLQGQVWAGPGCGCGA
jgi:hypothetical protein